MQRITQNKTLPNCRPCHQLSILKALSKIINNEPPCEQLILCFNFTSTSTLRFFKFWNKFISYMQRIHEYAFMSRKLVIDLHVPCTKLSICCRRLYTWRRHYSLNLNLISHRFTNISMYKTYVYYLKKISPTSWSTTPFPIQQNNQIWLHSFFVLEKDMLDYMFLKLEKWWTQGSSHLFVFLLFVIIWKVVAWGFILPCKTME